MKFRSLAAGALTNRYLALAFRLYIGSLFVYASIHKISYAGEFAESIASYQIAPYWAVNPMAVVMPWLELFCGILLLAGIRSKAAVYLIGVMLSMFAAAIAIALIRGVPIGCGCFSSTDAPMNWTTVARDILWLAMAVHIYFFDGALQLEKKFLVRISEV